MASYSNVRDYFQGRLGSLVYSSTRGTKYVKVFVPPGNPNTEAQQKVRSAWSTLAHIAHTIYEPILKPYTFPKPTKMSAHNVFVKTNAEMLHERVWKPEKLKLFDGSLPHPRGFDVDILSTGDIRIYWENSDMPFEKDTDMGIAVLIQDRSVVGFGTEERIGSQITIDLEQTNAHQGAMDVYLAFSQAPAPNTNESGATSFTAYAPLVIPAFRKWELAEAQSAPADAPAAQEGENPS